MAAKAIDTTSKKVLYWYFRGLPQQAVAAKCGVSQAKVSRCRAKFTKKALAFGIIMASKEYGIMGEVETLRELATQLHKADISVAEAKFGAEMVTLFDELDVVPGDYKKLVKALTEVPEPGFAAAAVKMINLEKTTGKGYGEAAAAYEEVTKKLDEGNQALAGLYQEKKQAEEAVMDMEDIRKQKEQDLTSFLEEAEKQKQDVQEELDTLLAGVALTKEQLAAVYPVVTTAHELGIADEDLTSFLEERLHLQVLGVTPKRLEDVAQALAEVGDLDTTNLKEKLGEFGSLEKSVTALDAVKASIESEVGKIKVTKLGLEKEVQDLSVSITHHEKKNRDLAKKVATLETSVASLTGQKEALKQQVQELEFRQLQLLKKTAELQQGIVVADDSLKTKTRELANLEAQVKAAGLDYQMFEVLIGLVGKDKIPIGGGTVKALNYVFNQVRDGLEHPDTFVKEFMSQMTGGALKLMGCQACGAQFVMVKRRQTSGPKDKGVSQPPSVCPDCGKNDLKKAEPAFSPMPKKVVKTQTVHIVQQPHDPSEQDKGST